MAWVTITPDLVLSRMSLTERTACDTDDTTSGEPSRLATIITDVTELVRGKIANQPYIRARMGPSGTVPSELRIASMNIIRHELLNSLALGETLLDPHRVKDYEDARDDIQAASEGRMVIQGINDTSYQPDTSIVGGKYQIGWLGRSRPDINVEDNPPEFGPAAESSDGIRP